MGEYSNVHATLADGLRKLGHQVTVLSNGDFWKNYPRDIDLVRKPGKNIHFIVYPINCYIFANEKSCLTSKRMQFAEFSTIAKSLPQLR